MSVQTKPCYEFGPFRLDPTERLLLRDDQSVSLTPKMFDILLLLVEHSGHVVEKEELMRAIWPDTFVEEANLAVNISALRKVLSEAPNGYQYIETVQRRGYRFEAEVRKWEEEAAGPREPENSNSAVMKADAGANGQAMSGLAREHTAKMAEAEARSAIPSAQSLILGIKRHPSAALFALAVLAIIGGGIAFGIYQLARQRQSKSVASFQTMRIAQLTANGKVTDAAISPDGKYVVYAVADAGKQSLSVKQVATESYVQIIPPSEAYYGGLTFSRDGNFIYYLKAEKGDPVSTLYQMPALGGAASKLITDISADTISFSPDGQRLAFLRGNPATGETALIVAHADGTGERALATRHSPENFARGPAWSPDDQIIACPLQGLTVSHYGIVAVPVGGGAEKLIGAQRWDANRIAWLPDGSGLVMAAVERVSGFIPPNRQLWQLSYPSGEARRITNDLNDYRGVSLTADANTLVTVRQDRLSNIWLVPAGESHLAKQITFGLGKYEGLSGLAWTPDGRIVYDSNASGRRNICIMAPDGANPRQLTVNAQAGMNIDPAVSPDGRFMVYVSATDRPHLWRMDMDGSNVKQLTDGDGEISPQLSPDGKWIIYTSFNSGRPVLLKIPVEGGASVPLTEKSSARPVISPDGKLIAYQHWDEQPHSRPRTVVIPFSGGAPIKSFELSTQQMVRWAGQALTYIETREGVSNIWSQPLDGGPPKQLTDFKADRIYNYAWSRDGKQLVCVRGVDVSDVILISGFR